MCKGPYGQHLPIDRTALSRGYSMCELFKSCCHDTLWKWELLFDNKISILSKSPVFRVNWDMTSVIPRQIQILHSIAGGRSVFLA
jgi:hypothetical protein